MLLMLTVSPISLTTTSINATAVIVIVSAAVQVSGVMNSLTSAVVEASTSPASHSLAVSWLEVSNQGMPV